MRLHAIKLNLALSFEVYTYVAKLCNLSTNSENDKNSEKRLLKTQIESYIQTALQIETAYITVFLFKLRNKQIYFVPCLPIEAHVLTEIDIKTITTLKTAVTNKTIQVKYKKRLKLYSETLKTTVDKIVNNPEQFTHFLMDSSDEVLQNTTNMLLLFP